MPQLRHHEIFDRAREARRLDSPCSLCPRRCGVDRASGERGYCRAGPHPAIATAIPHFGEEPPLVTAGGAGTIFFSRCNLRCVYCQNHQISQGDLGNEIVPEDLADKMLELQELECANIEPVSPSHHLPGLLESLANAVEKGLRLPVVYNTNGYENPETLDLLEGIVDVYVPDLKYSSPDAASRYSDARDYVSVAREAVLKMHAQVGNLVVDIHGGAVRGLIVRHLVLPEGNAGTRDTLLWIKDNLPATVTISLMAQYSPLHRSREFPPLDRAVTAAEYEEAVDLAWDLGFENVFVQDVESQTAGIPDFGSSRPFNWD